MGWGRREEGSGWGTHIYLWQIHFDIWQNQYNNVKLNKIKLKKKKSLLQHHSSKVSILWHSAFFIVQLSHPYMTTGESIALTRWTFVGRVLSLLFNMLSMLVIAFFFSFFYFTILYWFCHTSTCIHHGCTCVPHPEPLSYLPPHTIPLGHTSAKGDSLAGDTKTVYKLELQTIE